MDTEGGIGGVSSWVTPVWAVRLRRGDGTVVGTGVLVHPEWVLTSADAVTEGDRVAVEFVGVSGRPRAADADARCATAGGAYPTAVAGGLALLRLTGPGPSGAAGPLYRRAVPRREVRIHGFPRADGEGAWLRATTGAEGGGPDGRVRLAVPERVPRGFPPGFRGAGVTDAETGELLGLALPAPDPDADPRTYMSPAETIVRQLPQVLAWTDGPAAVDEALRPGHWGGRAALPDSSEPWAAAELPCPAAHLIPPTAATASVAPPSSMASAALSEGFATRLAAWFRGGGGRRRDGDGRQVKISLVHAGDAARENALRRAVVLADRELRPAAFLTAGAGPAPPIPRVPHAIDRPDTVPPPGSLDLAVDATGAPCGGSPSASPTGWAGGRTRASPRPTGSWPPGRPSPWSSSGSTRPRNPVNCSACSPG